MKKVFNSQDIIVNAYMKDLKVYITNKAKKNYKQQFKCHDETKLLNERFNYRKR